MFWKDISNFRIEDHIHIHDESEENVSKNGGNTEEKDKNKKRITSLTKYYLNKPWSKERALWEFILVPGIRPWDPSVLEHNAETFLLLLRFHHSLVDGYSIIKVLRCLDTSGAMQKQLDKITKKPRTKAPNVRNFMRSFILQHN